MSKEQQQQQHMMYFFFLSACNDRIRMEGFFEDHESHGSSRWVPGVRQRKILPMMLTPGLTDWDRW
jgi:hypothetical protein